MTTTSKVVTSILRETEVREGWLFCSVWKNIIGRPSETMIQHVCYDKWGMQSSKETALLPLSFGVFT